MSRMLLIALVYLLISGCAFNVIFTDRAPITQSRNTTPNSIDIYLDEDGNLYPPTISSLDKKEIKKKKNVRRALNFNNGDAWKDMQRQYWAEVVGEVKERIQYGQPLFILIHGFNVPADKGNDYYSFLQSELIKEISQRESTSPLFINVHWDGFVGLRIPFTKKTSPIGPWNEAQATGPLVGLHLRYLLKDLPNETPIRVVTHSSGAFVAASLIGDASAVLPLTQHHDDINCKTLGKPELYNYQEYRASASGSINLPIPSQSDIRIAMFAPATPSLSFRPDLCGHGGVLTSKTTLIVGGNFKDSATSKYRTPQGSQILGATSLNASRDEYTLLVGGLAENNRYKTSVFPYFVDFSLETPADKNLDKHKIESYWEKPEARKKILDLLILPKLNSSAEKEEN